MPKFVVMVEGGGSAVVDAETEQDAVLAVPGGQSARIAQWRDIEAHKDGSNVIKKIKGA